MNNPVYKKEISITVVATAITKGSNKLFWRLPNSSEISDSESIDGLSPSSDSDFLVVSNEDASLKKFIIDKQTLNDEYALQADALNDPIFVLPDHLDFSEQLELSVSNADLFSNYMWEASAGTFVKNTGETVTYIAPAKEAGSQLVRISAVAVPKQAINQSFVNSNKIEKYMYVGVTTIVKPYAPVLHSGTKTSMEETQEIELPYDISEGTELVASIHGDNGSMGSVRVEDNKVFYISPSITSETQVQLNVHCVLDGVRSDTTVTTITVMNTI